MKTIFISLLGVVLLLGACSHSSSNTADTSIQAADIAAAPAPSTTQAPETSCNITDNSTISYRDDVVCITETGYFFTEAASVNDGALRKLASAPLDGTEELVIIDCETLQELAEGFNLLAMNLGEFQNIGTTAEALGELDLEALGIDDLGDETVAFFEVYQTSSDLSQIEGTIEYTEAGGQCFLHGKKLLWLGANILDEDGDYTCQIVKVLFATNLLFNSEEAAGNFTFNWHNEDTPFNFCYLYVNPA